MACSRFTFFIMVACFAGCAGPAAAADTARAHEAEWSKLERQAEYPSCYSTGFVDSIAAVKHVSPAFSLRSFDSLPWAKGEKFVYEVGWGPFSAGYVILETVVGPADGPVVMSAKGLTNGFFSAIYKVRDQIRTTLDARGIYPFFFEQHLREGRYKADRWEMVDQARARVFTHDNDTQSYAAPQFVQNYFSLTAYVRALSFAPRDSFFIDCFMHNRSYRILSYCVERKPIQSPAGTFNCLLVKPVLVGEGRVFNKKDEVRLWLTNDAYKMPVMVQANIALGTITARLIWYERKD
ncbi:MAG TPA: DUF3108 domain-containing protein [Chitinivibrionales bacterium]|nr:DUF3108 domain-containing protein [Chitinivibrionales bacterium]